MIDNNDKNLIKSGYIAIIGKPNVGKSTLLNAIIQKKVSIVTHKPQTTRNQIKGIYNEKDLQIIIIDTPGIHKHRNLLGNNMNKYAFKSIRGVDVVLFVVPFNEPISNDDEYILQQIKKIQIPIFLVISKMDIVSNDQIDKKILEWTNKHQFNEAIPISSKENININRLIGFIKKNLPYAPRYFDETEFTDQPESFLIKEIIREKILEITNQEVPHSTCVLVNNIIEEAKIMKIYASIIVERKSQKLIMVGKSGNLIKKIGTEVRKELEILLNTKIYLDLFVKVEENWRENEQKLKKMGYGTVEKY